MNTRKHTALIRAALAINDPHSIIVTRHKTARLWTARTTGGEWRCTSPCRKGAIAWGRNSQAMILRTYTTNIRAYCGRTGKRLS